MSNGERFHSSKVPQSLGHVGRLTPTAFVPSDPVGPAVLRQKIQRELHVKARKQQHLHNLARPKTEVKTVLVGALAVDPAKDLTFMCGRELARPSRSGYQ